MNARLLGWGLAGLALLVLLTGFALLFASGAQEVELPQGIAAALVIGFAIVGALVASRQPRNAIGWTFCGIGVTGSLMSLARGCAELWLNGDGVPEALGQTAAWYGDVSWIPVILPAATFVLLLFPDGRLPSPRWRPIAWSAAGGIVALFVVDSTNPGPLADYPQVDNPYPLDGVLVDVLGPLSVVLLAVAIVGSPLSLVLRFRRARRERRQQIKWLALAGAIEAVTFVIAVAGYEVWTSPVADGAIMLSLVAFPVAAGIAILRYRLYDIDVVINRTLVYGGVTATLAATYAGLVLLLQLVLSPGSDLAIAASTLAVAGLFRPARLRIQGLVDRRFYRRKYDAQLTLERFGASLRDEVDLDALAAELRGLAFDTMQPAHVSLWLREPEVRS